MLFAKSKPSTREGRVLQQLKKAGHYGTYGHELARPGVGGHRFGSAIADLRKDGHSISVVRITNGNYKYYLDSEN